MKQLTTKARTKPKPGTGSNIVKSYIRSAADNEPKDVLSTTQLIAALKQGLPYQEIEDLRQQLNLPIEKLVSLLGISLATLHRRKAAGKLDVFESDRVIRFARLLGKATLVMESLPAACSWLSTPQRGLGGSIPLEFAATEQGAREVEYLLGRIEHGVYS
jgi:putative toxin-antitoxin system antitoxin component (TIGR02293 family)